MPGWYGMTSVKWLQRITVVSEPFDGYQMVTGYRMRRDEDDPGTPVTRIEPRSLMVPPGIPDFMTRRRFLPPGRVRLEGRAWSGWGPIELVELSVDGGLLDARDAGFAARAGGVDAVVDRLAGRGGRARAAGARDRRHRPPSARRAALEPRRLRQQRGPTGGGHRHRVATLTFEAALGGYLDRVERCVQSWPAAPEHVGSARRVVSAAARRAGADDPVLDAVRLAVSEAVSNVVVHGYRGSARGAFTVAVEWEGDELRVTVRDEGCGMQPRADSPGAGLGLPLIANLAETFSVTAPPGGGTELRMTFSLGELAAA